jgi:hypothetical protein
MAFHVRNATDDLINFTVFAARNSITLARMQDTKNVDSVIAIQNFAAAGGFVMQANEITVSHRLALDRTAIWIHDAVAFLRCAYLPTIIQSEFQWSRRLLDHPAVTGLAAFGCHSVNRKRGMGSNVNLLLFNNRESFFAEAGKLQFRKR